ncbi:MAG: malQ [Burkholderiales bacterium]|jgi:4-alpha-glucanotransferase|nr:malQ [Burkholderiales bacterium]
MKCGSLMPISALPSDYGIGDFGDGAYQFVDILSSMGMKIWQVLPLNPLGFGNSPYQAYSSFAGDEIYISPDRLVAAGLLDRHDIKPFNAKYKLVEYIKVRKNKRPLLLSAFKKFKQSPQLRDQYQKFIKQNQWVDTYAIYQTFKKINGSKIWTEWPEKYKNWLKNKQVNLKEYIEQTEYEKFIQFIFYWQWLELKKYANERGIEIMGDIPIYLGLDSADVWANQDLFLLDKTGNPTNVAGVPPDFFSADGQRWGNPLYDWDKLKATNFKFWIERLSGNARLFDILRIDHFRAFDTYWKIPASCKTAIDGEWVIAPGDMLFKTIYQKLPEIKVVAEDLGDLRPEVYTLRDKYKLPGMKVFQFHFDLYKSNKEFENNKNMVIYTGTHDNTTLLDWYSTLSPKNKRQLRSRFKIANKGPNSISRDLRRKIISYILNCKAKYVIFPIQDILGFDACARINIPGKIGSPNWEWRLADYIALKAEAQFIAQAIKKSKRVN